MTSASFKRMLLQILKSTTRSNVFAPGVSAKSPSTCAVSTKTPCSPRTHAVLVTLSSCQAPPASPVVSMTIRMLAMQSSKSFVAHAKQLATRRLRRGRLKKPWRSVSRMQPGSRAPRRPRRLLTSVQPLSRRRLTVPCSEQLRLSCACRRRLRSRRPRSSATPRSRKLLPPPRRLRLLPRRLRLLPRRLLPLPRNNLRHPLRLDHPNLQPGRLRRRRRSSKTPSQSTHAPTSTPST